MKLNSTISTDPIDELCQIRDELRVVWLALGNDNQAEAYRVEIGEHVNGIANRIHDLVETMAGEALTSAGRGLR